MIFKPAILGLLLLGGLLATSPAPATNTVTESELDSVIALYRAEGAEKALPEFARLHAEYEKGGDGIAASKAERYIGECYWQLGNYEQARDHLERVLTLTRKLGQRLDEGKTLNVLGLLEWDLGNYELAIDDFKMASLIGSELGDRRLAGSTMNNLSLVYDELGDYQTSLKQYQQALDLYKGADFPRGESDTLGNIGGVNLLLGRYQDALVYYQRALSISVALHSKPSMSLDHGNLALCYLGLGQVDTALEHFELALDLAREAGMRKEEALWQRGKGNALIRKGEYDLGLQNHRAALKTYEAIDARGLLIDALHDMGELHLALGDTVSAEKYFQRGIEMARKIGLAQAVTDNLLALGDLQFKRGNFEKADAQYSQALQRATDAGELNYQADSLLSLAFVHREQQRFDDADTEARRALALAGKISANFLMTEAWFAIGELARDQGRLELALEAFAAAQAVAMDHMDPGILWQIHYGRARVLVGSGKRNEAVAELKAAVRIIESARERLREERFKAGYIQDKYQVYIDLVRLQLQLGRTEEAFSTAERLRSRSFLDQLESNVAVSRNEQDFQRELALRERVRQLQITLAEEQARAPAERRQSAEDTFSAELFAAERDYQAFLDDINGQSVIARATRLPVLSEVQTKLEPGEALIEYVVGDESLMIFVMQRDKLTAVIEKLRSTDLYAKVNLVRDLIQDPSSDDWWTPAASLTDSLIKPLQDKKLLAGIRHLYLVPHGILNYLPFALLPLDSKGGERVLMEQYTLSYLPAAATLAQETQKTSAPNSMLAIAPENTGLQYALEEARLITQLYQPGSRLLSGDEATESAFKQQARDYRVLHFSTHGYFNMRNPLFSGLELAADGNNDGRLEVHEILGLSLNAVLVTLSACESGMGSGYFNELPAGDEFIGLARAFLLAGSHSVLATLWPVDDRSTVAIMEGFYKRMEQAGRTDGHNNNQAVALAQVQRDLKNSSRYKHPFYWAPFVLIGQQDRGAGARI